MLHNWFNLLSLSIAQADAICLLIEAAAEEVEGGQWKFIRQVPEKIEGLHFGGGIAVKIEYKPVIFVFWLIESECYFFVLVEDSDIIFVVPDGIESEGVWS